ncbi:MAG: phosphatidate cytidylyltransferase [Spirulinaceae cyanobacterium RM2_2_10]|nr:phosphatidate cytidylyltransferase [Spirulinaceae cyanobacterium SM2_1_0]NJO20243.1 phosphatidate cytidylyltransferase [Spirulinaceae cyanobacterium RM2_2_10]
MLESVTGFSPPLPLPTAIALVALYLAAIVGLAEGLNRLLAADAEFTRKIVHIGSGQVILLAWLLAIPGWVGVAAAVVAAAIALLSYFLPILPSINSVGRQSLGTFFYASSIGILCGYFFPQQLPQYAAIGILVMAWGDGLAAIIGRQFGRHPYKIAGNQKSLEGTLAMLTASFLVTFVILGLADSSWATAWPVALAIALAATLLETFSQFGIDNLTVPVGSAFLSFYLSRF